MGTGLDWYPREPIAVLGDTQGLSSREHCVYNIIIDLLYVHGGTIRNDPSFIAGFVKDMGPAAVRNTIKLLDANPRITIIVDKDEISQKRAKNQAKTKQKRSENAAENGKKGGEKSAELRAASKENNNLVQPSATLEIQPEKRREENIHEHNLARAQENDLTLREKIIVAMGHDRSGITVNGKLIGAPTDMLELKRWLALGLSEGEIVDIIAGITHNKSDGPAGAFKYFTNSMTKYAGLKAQPDLKPLMPVGGQTNGKQNYQDRQDEKLRRVIIAGAEGTSNRDWG